MNEEARRREEAFCILTAIVDFFDGDLEMNTSTVKRLFCDAQNRVNVELVDGRSMIAGDATLEQLEVAINEWKGAHSELFLKILMGMWQFKK